MSKPNFIIVGAAKAGTTTVYEYLNQHPDIFLPGLKEPHFFTSDQSFNFPVISQRQAYADLFSPGLGKMCGEASTSYLYFPGTAQRIRQENEDCRILIMVRDPLEIAFSMWGHQRREGLEDESFGHCVVEELNSGTRLMNGVSFGFNYVRQARISEAISEYISVFGAEQVLLCPLQKLQEQPQELLSDIFEFLGVETKFRIAPIANQNISGNPASEWLHDQLNSQLLFKRVFRAPLRLLLGKERRHRLWVWLRDRNIELGPEHEMDPLTRRMLEDALGSERETLGQLLSYFK